MKRLGYSSGPGPSQSVRPMKKWGRGCSLAGPPSGRPLPRTPSRLELIALRAERFSLQVIPPLRYHPGCFRCSRRRKQEALDAALCELLGTESPPITRIRNNQNRFFRHSRTVPKLGCTHQLIPELDEDASAGTTGSIGGLMYESAQQGMDALDFEAIL